MEKPGDPSKVAFSSTTILMAGDDDDAISVFLCPITHDFMQDPVLAADGMFNHELLGNILLI